MRTSRIALLASGAVNLGFAAYFYRTAPALVPLHFGISGAPDRWGSPSTLFTMHLLLSGFVTSLFVLLPEVIRRAPAAIINLPNKNYWLTPERRETAVAKFGLFADAFGTALNLFFVCLQLVLPHGSNSMTVSPDALAWLTLSFLVFTACSGLLLALSYRVPCGG